MARSPLPGHGLLDRLATHPDSRQPGKNGALCNLNGVLQGKNGVVLAAMQRKRGRASECHVGTHSCLTASANFDQKKELKYKPLPPLS